MRSLAAGAGLLVLGCLPDGGASTTMLSVFAASSLTDAFNEVARAFEARTDGVDVQLSFAGSQVLRLQIEQGARTDLYVSANPEHVASLVEGDLAGDVTAVATNDIVTIVPRDNPAGIQSFDQLPRSRRLVLGAEAVPVGVYSRRVLMSADAAYGGQFAERVLARVVSEELNTRLVRAKVELGVADAALVYRTDALASEDVHTIEIPAPLNVEAEYLAATIAPAPGAQAPRAALARSFVAFIRSDEGRSIMRRFGFGPAP